ncbi:MAG: hypothetical protein NDI91_04225 [Sulfuritalea sp.]|nr:hypothetical protein [Sulfuritalea sp.]
MTDSEVPFSLSTPITGVIRRLAIGRKTIPNTYKADSLILLTVRLLFRTVSFVPTPATKRYSVTESLACHSGVFRF